MSKLPVENETKRETVSFRVTSSFYRKVIKYVDASSEASLSDYARNALIQRIEREDREKKCPINKNPS